MEKNYGVRVGDDGQWTKYAELRVMSASDNLSAQQHKYSATRNPQTKKWQGWVAFDGGRDIADDPQGFVHPTRAQAIQTIKSQHPPKKI